MYIAVSVARSNPALLLGYRGGTRNYTARDCTSRSSDGRRCSLFLHISVPVPVPVPVLVLVLVIVLGLGLGLGLGPSPLPPTAYCVTVHWSKTCQCV